jgi:hypothetical protein
MIRIPILAAYADLIDGVRSHYARREGDDSSAAYGAVMALSTLFIANVYGAGFLLNELLNRGHVTLGPWIRSNRGVVILFAILVIAFHWLLAKQTGVYNRRGGPRAPLWAHRFRIYVWLTVCISLAPIAIVIARHTLDR